MRRLSFIITVLTLLPLLSISAQETAFGKNKVRYKNFDWNYIQTRHFDIYFYEQAYPTAKFCADVLESSYIEITKELNFVIQKRFPIFIYNSHNDFQQTNITSGLLSEGIGGFTEVFKTRIVIPFTGSYEDFRHVIHHELTHAVIYNMLFGNSFASILSRQRLFNLPLWFAEGYAEYSSRHGWDYFSDMFVRDATINGYLAPPLYLGGFLAYKQGQMMVKFIAEKYGEEKLSEILQKGRIHLTMEKAMKNAIGITLEEFWKEFSKEMKRRYWPAIATYQEADEIGKQLTKARKDGSFFNEKPTYSPDGGRLAIFTDKSDFTQIVLISPHDGKTIKKLVNSSRSGDLESLHAYVSGMSFSPDGKSIVFVAKSGGKEAIMFLDVADNKIYKKKRLDFYNLLSPVWSPDGNMIAFSALDGHKRDLYLYYIKTDRIEQLTDDRYDDVEPSWFPDSKRLLFSSDRPHPQNPVLDGEGHPYVNSSGAFHPGDFEYGSYNIFKIERGTEKISPIDVGPGHNRIPKVSPDGSKVAFISNRNGIDNLYIGLLDSTKYYAVTNVLTGIFYHSWHPDGDRLAFSAFYQGAFDIFVLNELIPAGDNGILPPTDYVLGKYDLLGVSDDEAVASVVKEVIPDSTSADNDNIEDSTLSKTPDSLQTASNDNNDDKTAAIASKNTTVLSDSTTTASVDTTILLDSTTTALADTTILLDSTVTLSEKAKDTTITETGVYDDEYVFVSDNDESALDEVLVELGNDSTLRAKRLEEPASFDSIQPLLPSGEYKIKKYKVNFTPDFVGGGFAYDTFFGVRGQSYFVFSDFLGNHQIYLVTDLVNSIDQSYIQAYYFNNKKRTNLGIGFFHTKNFYRDNRNFLFSDRFYGIQAFANRPYSIFKRIEGSLGQVFIDRKYRDINDPREDRSSKVSTASVAYVFDNVLWGSTGPVNGNRTKFEFDGGVNLFNSTGISFYSVNLDYRKYWHFKKTFSMAFRLTGGASFGKTPKQYFLGGTTNWIGTRTLDAKVYEVENLYFSDIVTPLRGQDYYGLSGDRYALVNWEFRFPMVQYFAMRYPLPIVLSNITGVIFTDMGATWFGNNFKGGSTADGISRLNDVKTGFGVGMRINLFGFALLRYDIAWSTDFYKVSAKPKTYFSFGADF